MEPVAFIMSSKAQHRIAHSALPNAPVVDDGRSPEALAKRRQRVQTLRLTMARTLRRAADRVEPNCATA